MNGAESLVRAAREAGIEVCFSNPGTSEMPLVAAFDSEPGLRGVLVLFEGVASGAADGYGRMAEKPALTLFHLGPGHGNAVANLHNAKRGRSPVVNLVGDHATWHRRYNPPLATDIKSLARPVSDWFRECRSAASLGRDVRKAIATAWTKPGRFATLTVPTDCQWGDAGNPRFGRAARSRAAGGRERRGRGGAPRATRRRQEHAADRRVRRAAARTARRRAHRRRDRLSPRPRDLPHSPRARSRSADPRARALLPRAGARLLRRPAHASCSPARSIRSRSSAIRRGSAGSIPDGIEVITLARPEDDVERALDDLASALDAPATLRRRTTRRAPAPPPSGPITAASVAQAIAAAQPEGAVVVDEGITSSGAYLPLSTGCRAVDLPRAHRRRDRMGAALRHRRRARRARPQGDRARGRRQRSLHHPVAVDAGARAARRRQRRLRQRHLPHPADRAPARRHRAPGTAGTGAHRSRPARRSTGRGIAKGFGVPWSRADTAEALYARARSARSPSPGRRLIEVRVPGVRPAPGRDP